jgi:hypothetical protein
MPATEMRGGCSHAKLQPLRHAAKNVFYRLECTVVAAITKCPDVSKQTTFYCAVTFLDIALPHQQLGLMSMQQLDTQRDAMHWLVTQIPRGKYWWWTAGTVPAGKLVSVAEKLNDQYCTMIPPMARYRAGFKGATKARAVSAPLPDGTAAHFVLIADRHLPRETMRDARERNGRLIWGDYILLPTTKPRELRGGLSWSWHLLPQIRGEMEDYGSHLIKSNPGALVGFWERQLHRPMFAGVRSQTTAMLRSQAKLWSRVHPNRPWPAVDPTQSLPYVGTLRAHRRKKVQTSST